jgi:hypothetical protein
MSTAGGTTMRPTAQLRRVIANQKDATESARAKGRSSYRNDFVTAITLFVILSVLFILAYSAHENDWFDSHHHHHGQNVDSHDHHHDHDHPKSSHDSHDEDHHHHLRIERSELPAEQLDSFSPEIVRGKSIADELFSKLHLSASQRYTSNEATLLKQLSPLPAKAVSDPAEPPKDRGIYGGGSDPNHVGGFLFNDSASYEPLIWNFMTSVLNVSSVMDMGCGQGVSTQWFRQQGHLKDVICVEGSSDAVSRSLVHDVTVEHDYSRGAWWPSKIYDAAWVVEFVGAYVQSTQ